LTDPAVFTGSISIWEYVGVFIQNLRFKSPANIAIFFMILAGGGILMRKSADAYGDRLSQMFTLCFTFIVVRFFLYPAFYPRYYIPYFLLIGAFFAVRFSLLLGAYPALNRAPNPVFSFLFRPAILPIAHLRHVRQAHTSRDLPR
jgi:predicted MFS family arabinose efflux permease